MRIGGGLVLFAANAQANQSCVLVCGWGDCQDQGQRQKAKAKAKGKSQSKSKGKGKSENNGKSLRSRPGWRRDEDLSYKIVAGGREELSYKNFRLRLGGLPRSRAKAKSKAKPEAKAKQKPSKSQAKAKARAKAKAKAKAKGKVKSLRSRPGWRRAEDLSYKIPHAGTKT